MSRLPLGHPHHHLVQLCIALAAALAPVGCGQTTAAPATVPDSAGASDGAVASGDAAADTGGSSAADTAAGTDAAVPLACGTTQVNDTGLGRPCTKPEDCFGQPAVTCIDTLGAGAPRFCVQYCFGLPNECGDEGVCVPRGPKEAAVCMPVGCAALYSIAVPNNTSCTIPCDAGSINSFGVGKQCSTMDDCKGNFAAKTCPVVLRPDNPTWCSMLCTDDSECGDNAICWRRKTVEFGVEFVVGSCAPAKCCTTTK